MSIRTLTGRITRMGKLFARVLINLLPLASARQVLFRVNYGRRLDLRSPTSFNEKVNWRIVYDRRPELVTLSSKELSKRYVAEVCPDLRIPRTIWVGRDLRELEEVDLPDQWVLKTVHRSGFVYFGSGQPDIRQLARKTRRWLWRDDKLVGRLWAYSQLRAEYILEERIGVAPLAPDDYKFFVFNGEVQLVQVDTGRFGDHTRNLYLADWTPLDDTFTTRRGPTSKRPANLEAMVRYAKSIGEGLDFVRVDLFNIEGTIYFGEATVYPGAGLSHWSAHLDGSLGLHWQLPNRGDVAAGPRS